MKKSSRIRGVTHHGPGNCGRKEQKLNQSDTIIDAVDEAMICVLTARAVNIDRTEY